MGLSIKQLSLNAIFSFCLSVDDVNLEKDISATSFYPVSVLVEVCSSNMFGVSSLRFLLAKRWFSSSPCFPFRLKKIADWPRLVCLVGIQI